MSVKIAKVTVVFKEPVLGTIGGNKEIYSKYILSKAPPAKEGDEPNNELETLPTLEDVTTGFHRTSDGKPFIYNYAAKGFFKAACGSLRRVPDTASAKVRAFLKIIDGTIFVRPRQMLLNLSGPLFMLERSIRVQTAQGERVALARSEAAPAETTMEFEVVNMGAVPNSVIQEWLTYGAFSGFGQWRNAEYGRFEYTWENVTG